MKYFLLAFCLTTLLMSRVSCNTCDVEEFRKCYLNADTDTEEETCFQMTGCEQMAEDFKKPIDIDVPFDGDE